MAKPAFIRYLPARLKPLGNPAVWVPLSMVALLGTFAWEYSRNPNWFDREPITTLAPDSALTPEEEARLSEIDTLDVLLNGSRVPEGTAPVTSQINPDAPESQRQAIDTDDEGVALNAYPIPGAPSTTTTITPGQSSVFSDPNRPTTRTAGSSGSLDFNFGNGLANTTATPPATNSALAEALARREADLSAIEQGDQSPRTIAGGDSPSAPFGAGSAGAPVQALPAANPVPGSFIRTTPNMSPPAGTTGYQVPASANLPTFNIPAQQPTRSPFSLPPAPGQFGASTAPTGSVVPAPIVATPSVVAPFRAATPSTLYTPPSSVQPNQGPAINPRR